MLNYSQLESIQSFENLVKELDNKVHLLEINYAEHINCRNKCFDCCCNIFNISVIEGYYLQQGYDLLLEEDQNKIKQNVALSLESFKSSKNLDKINVICPLLFEDSCLLYEYRPLICRAFGVPIKDESTGAIATCNKNFKELKNTEVTLDTLSLKTLSVQMVVLSQFLMKELGRDLDKHHIPPLYSILDIIVAKLGAINHNH